MGMWGKNEDWTPEKRVLTTESLDTFYEHQIIYHESILAARVGTHREKTEETRALKMMVAELKNLRWKAQKLFMDVPAKKKSKELTTV